MSFQPRTGTADGFVAGRRRPPPSAASLSAMRERIGGEVSGGSPLLGKRYLEASTIPSRITSHAMVHPSEGGLPLAESSRLSSMACSAPPHCTQENRRGQKNVPSAVRRAGGIKVWNMSAHGPLPPVKR